MKTTTVFAALLLLRGSAAAQGQADPFAAAEASPYILPIPDAEDRWRSLSAGFCERPWSPPEERTPERLARFKAELLGLLSSTPDGSALLKRLTGECRRAGKRVKLETFLHPDTVARDSFDGPAVEGLLGYTQPDEWTIGLNRELQNLRGKPARRRAAVILGHEMAHMTLEARVARALPEHREALGYASADEKRSRLVQMILARQLHTGGAFPEGRAIASLRKDPERHWSAIKLLDPSYALTLDRDEMRDPAAAYRRRGAAIERERAWVFKELEDFGFWEKALQHMLEAHPDALRSARPAQEPEYAVKELLPSLETERELLEIYEKSLAEALSAVSAQRAFLENEGRGLTLLLKDAAGDPRFQRLVERPVLRKQARLLAEPPLEDDPRRPLDWEDFWELWSALHGPDGAERP